MGQLLCFYGETVAVNGVTYDVVKGIGEGAFSYVQLVRRGKQNYALKRVLIQIPEHEEMIHREIKHHKTLNHKYIMKLIDEEVVENHNKKEARLLFPYHQLGSVQELIEVSNITKEPMKEEMIVSLFQSLCEAVNVFHKSKPPIAHRDIKPHNLLIGENNTVILMDLGSAREARVRITSRKEAVTLQDLCAADCTAAYRAPELFEVPSDCIITEKTDIWALGCTLYALLYGDSPCDGSALSSMNPQIKLSSIYSNKLNSLIKAMLQIEPECRPTVDDILKILTDNIDSYDLTNR